MITGKKEDLEEIMTDMRKDMKEEQKSISWMHETIKSYKEKSKKYSDGDPNNYYARVVQETEELLEATEKRYKNKGIFLKEFEESYNKLYVNV